jgi:hypothetical protein
VQGSAFDETRFFAAIAASPARALLIGRRALVAYGLPLMTRDYGFWIHGDDAAAFNAAVAPFGLRPTCTPDEARTAGRYVLENDEHVDVLVARAVSTLDGVAVSFDAVWSRHVVLDLDIATPCLDDLILTKKFGGRPRDADDVRMLEELRDRSRG